MLSVLDGGLQTTVQDAGRFAWYHIGMPPAGAMDQFSFRVGNMLLGLLSAVLLEKQPVALLLLPGFVFLHYLAFREYVHRRVEQERSAELARSERDLIGKLDFEALGEEAVVAAGRIFQCTVAELVLIQPDNSYRRWRTDRDQG